ncbi:MerR family transcriptional regulator [Cellulosimicrobium funkei]|uniref:MerR family transcriptional regulator n=1 Tax=Cellulosimicrobium funkei TaxID=264251 RepID=UPI0037DC917B
MSDPLTPQAAAARAGVSLDTLRYYEREGLIGPIARTTGGHRAYDGDDLFWIGLVTCLRAAGLGIAELREFTSLLRREGSPADRVAFLQGHRRELRERRARIDLALGVLDDKIAYYREQSGESPAPSVEGEPAEPSSTS